jgi:hypothetical protein
MSQHRLTEQQKIYVVQRLAAHDALTAIVRGLQDEFGITVSSPAVLHYDPERPGSRCLAQRWKDLFWQARKAHLARLAAVGDTDKPARIRRRQAMMHEAWAAGRHRVANNILDSIAKEIGATTRRRMNTPDGAARLEQPPPESIPLNVDLHETQGIALESDATEILYGGAAGSGTSFLLRTCAIAWCAEIPGLQVYLFRRTRDDLVKNHVEGPTGFRALLAPWIAAGGCEIVADEIRFCNGAQIFLCHCKEERNVSKYQGAEIHVLLIDELTHVTEDMYRFLRDRVRMVGMTVPDHCVGRFPRILCGADPGNVGHLWVKRTFIDGRRPLAIDKMPQSEGGMRRQYVPARPEDNPRMARDDPG